MGKIREKIIASLGDRAAEERVGDVRIGLGYTAVQLDSGPAGVAYTFRQDLPGGCSVFQGLRPLAGRRAGDLVSRLNSEEKLESAVALATVNALVNQGLEGTLPGDMLEILELRPDDRVGMVGYFSPMIPTLEKRVKKLLVFEEQTAIPGVMVAKEALQALSGCQVALITSTTLINDTLDDLLSACRACREVVLLGASTPLLSQVFEKTPVTWLSGVEVVDPQAILQIVSEGGGMRFFTNKVRKVNLNVQR
jgi:hypothetical protein